MQGRTCSTALGCVARVGMVVATLIVADPLTLRGLGTAGIEAPRALQSATFSLRSVQIAAGSASAALGCFSTFSVGNADTVCISDRGNIGLWTSYGASSHFLDEGYKVCDVTSGVTYLDQGSVEFGWDISEPVQPKGPNTFPLAFERRTSDGRWLLIQSFTRHSVRSELVVTMKLVNLTSEPRIVHMLRRADLTINGNFGNHFDRTVDTIWVRDDSGTGGVSLRGAPVTVPYSTHIEAGGTFGGDCTPTNDPVPGIGRVVVSQINFGQVTVKPGDWVVRKVVYSRI